MITLRADPDPDPDTGPNEQFPTCVVLTNCRYHREISSVFPPTPVPGFVYLDQKSLPKIPGLLESILFRSFLVTTLASGVEYDGQKWLQYNCNCTSNIYYLGSRDVLEILEFSGQLTDPILTS